MIADVALGRRLQHELRLLRSARERWDAVASPAIETKIAAKLSELWDVEKRLADVGLLLTSEGNVAPIPVPA